MVLYGALFLAYWCSDAAEEFVARILPSLLLRARRISLVVNDGVVPSLILKERWHPGMIVSPEY